MATTPGYDPKKAALFNQLRQQMSASDAAAQAGIPRDEIGGTYVITGTYLPDPPGGKNPNPGAMGAPVEGSQKVAGRDFDRVSAADQAENDRFDRGLQSESNFEQVDYQVEAKNPPSKVTPINYTTTSTETVSGGGSTNTVSGPRVPTATSQAIGTAFNAKQAEIDQFQKDNPSDFTRKIQKLPPLSEAEKDQRDAKLLELTKERGALKNQQIDAERATPGTATTVPNTTTTTTTTTTGTAAVNTDVPSPGGADAAINQQTEVQLGTAVGASNVRSVPANVETNESVSTTPPTEVAESVFDPDGIDARLEAEQAQLREAEGAAIFAPNPVLGSGDEAIDAANEAELAQLREAEGRAIFSPAPVPPSQAGPIGVAYDDDGNLMPGYTLTENGDPVFVGGDFVEPATAASAEASRARGLTNNAQGQSTLQTRVTQTAAADWRVRLRLAPNATYLYKAANPGILKPLANTDGVIFPYTPAIDTSYTAKYDSYDLTHSNYRGYFYKNSTVENITVKGTFTAQDTREAEYLLAVIHFFRSVTKMFYGQDPQAGAPPPLVYLSGFGQFQFNEHPCVVSSFAYNLPNDVDYIRATGFNNIGLNLENRRTQSSGPSIGGSLGTVVAIIDRLKNAKLPKGGIGDVNDAGQIAQMNQVNATTAQNSVNSTYVPTKMEISITLLPMQTRNQVSKQFSLEGFAQGRLLSGGFW